MILGIDLSEPTVRLVLADRAGHVRTRAEVTQSDRDPGGIGEAVRRMADTARVAAAAVAMPVPGAAVPPDLARALQSVLPRTASVTVVCAGAALALSEAGAPGPDPARCVVGLAVGEHVSAGLLIDGQPWSGAHGLAGSIGWLAINPVERDDYRRYGGLEAEISSAGIVRRFVWRVKSGDHSAVADLSRGDFSHVTSDQIFAGARAGDGVSISVVRDTVRYLGMAVANLVAIVDPVTVVLGGAMATSGDLWLEPVRTECARRVHPQQAERLLIDLASHGVDAVAIGAARAATPRHA